MRRAGLAVALLLVSGCTHMAPPRPAFDCVDEMATEKRRISTRRVLDETGRQLRVEGNWFEHNTVANGVSFGAGWYAQAGDPANEPTHISLMYDHLPDKAMKRVGGVELRWGSPSNRATDARLVNRKRANLGVFFPWSLLRQLAGSGQPLYLVMIDRQEQVLRSDPLDPVVFDRALADIRATIAGSAAKAKDPARLCAPYEEIIVT